MEKIYEEIFEYISKFDKISKNQLQNLELKYGVSTIIDFFEYYLYDKDITEETKIYLEKIREQYENNGQELDDNLKIYLREITNYPILAKNEEKYHLTIIEKYRNLVKNISYETLTKELNKIEELSKITLDEYNIDKYLELLNSQSFLSIDEEKNQKLINKITAFKLYQKSFNTMINHNLKFVVFYAKKYIGNGLDFLDLIQEGNEGLITAVNKYKNEYNTRFTTCAAFWINSKILTAIKTKGNAIHTSTRTYDKEKLYKISIQTLLKKGMDLTTDNIYETMLYILAERRLRQNKKIPRTEENIKKYSKTLSKTITKEQIIELEKLIELRNMLSLNETVRDNENKEISLISLITDKNTKTPEEIACENSLIYEIPKIIDSSNQKTASKIVGLLRLEYYLPNLYTKEEIIDMFKNDRKNKYSIDEIETIVNSIYNIPKNKKLTLNELGSILTSSHERIRQLEKQGLEVIRRSIANDPVYKPYYDSWMRKSKKKK